MCLMLFGTFVLLGISWKSMRMVSIFCQQPVFFDGSIVTEKLQIPWRPTYREIVWRRQKKLYISWGLPDRVLYEILISLTRKHLTWRFPKPKDAQFFCELAVKIIPSEISFWRESQRQKEFLCRAILDGICLLVARQNLFPCRFFQLPWWFLSTQG